MGQQSIISKNIFKRLLLDMVVYLFWLDLIDVELLATEARSRLSPRDRFANRAVLPASRQPHPKDRSCNSPK